MPQEKLPITIQCIKTRVKTFVNSSIVVRFNLLVNRKGNLF
jgi:hypothetical protein